MREIETKNAPSAIGPYSQAVVSGNWVFASAQLGIDPKNEEAGLVPGGAAKQAERAILNLKAVLESAGSGLEHVVRTTCYLAGMADFAAFNGVYMKMFTHKPARSCIAAKQLPRDALVLIEAIAEINSTVVA
jgi:reactive intermediate/imine deaminase